MAGPTAFVEFRAGTDSAVTVGLPTWGQLHRASVSMPPEEGAYTADELPDVLARLALKAAFMGKQRVLVRVRLVGGESLMVHFRPDSAALARVWSACNK